VPALELEQTPGRKLYSFAVDGKLLPEIASVSRIHQSNGHGIGGYQRPEVLAHIAEIRAYLESSNPMMPTSVVLALDSTVAFKPSSRDEHASEAPRLGILAIPLGDRKPGWIVDGQQRVAAIRDSKLASFPIFVTAFISGSDKDQREQFILVNSPKPLPKDLIYELLPGTESKLPSLLQRRRYSSALLQRLNHDDDSPMKGLVKTPTNPTGVIKDNSILRMLENSLSDGALYRFRFPRSLEGNTESMLKVLKAFWSAIAEVFPEAWGVSPRRSRLMHGAGIVGVGLLMDAITERLAEVEIPTRDMFTAHVEPMRAHCHWTDGIWTFSDGSQRKWNEIQNVPRDVQKLAFYLLDQYQREVAVR